MIVNLNEKSSQAEFGNIIGVSQQLVSDLAKRGVIESNQALGEWLKRYCSHMREIAAGRAAEGGLDLAAERAALAREQRIRIEMQNAVTRREYGPIDALETGLADCLSKIAAQLDTIPGKLKRRSDRFNADDLNVVSQTIAEVRNTLASMEINWFNELTDGQDDDDLEATSQSSD